MQDQAKIIKEKPPHLFATFLRLLGLITLCLLLVLSLLTPPAQPTYANRALPTDLSYNTETTWILPGLPDLNEASGYIPHNFSHGEAVFQMGQETVHGFRPGKAYAEMYIRDIAWGMETAQYYYPDEYLREPIEAYLRRQYTDSTVSSDGDYGVVAGAGAIGGIITPQGRSNKQTITTDEETSLIHAAYLYYNLAYNTDWLKSPVNGKAVIERLNLAADWLIAKRLDPQLQLLWRGHTTDWGDVKFEKGPNYTDFNPARDHKTASIYDQALAYMALRELAEMNRATGDNQQADQWQATAEALKVQTNARLWQANKGFYLTHAHITPLEHPFDESSMVSISNALAAYTGLADLTQDKAIFQSLEQTRVKAGVNKPGLSIYPFYPNQWPNLFFDYLGMGYGNYQNGGVWDWWGGVQIKAEFQTGFAEQAQVHLLQVANDWQKHPGNLIEWHSSTDPRHEGSSYYSAAAGTMGSAIIEGFFGVELNGQESCCNPVWV
ncbi:MAG: trehalase family glycosidase [Anaerolineae bacterium]